VPNDPIERWEWEGGAVGTDGDPTARSDEEKRDAAGGESGADSTPQDRVSTRSRRSKKAPTEIGPAPG
jgi:hypothetical protein